MTAPTTPRLGLPLNCLSGRVKAWDSEGVAGAILGGWQVNGIASAVSGTPFTVSAIGRIA
ncbi:MAG: hypothetical protein WKF84_08630 [Pyrinomonadaceae bacterium]